MRRERTLSSQRARRSESGFAAAEDLSTTLRAKGEEEEEEGSETRKTVPIAPRPRTRMALRLSRSNSIVTELCLDISSVMV